MARRRASSSCTSARAPRSSSWGPSARRAPRERGARHCRTPIGTAPPLSMAPMFSPAPRRVGPSAGPDPRAPSGEQAAARRGRVDAHGGRGGTRRRARRGGRGGKALDAGLDRRARVGASADGADARGRGRRVGSGPAGRERGRRGGRARRRRRRRHACQRDQRALVRACAHAPRPNALFA